MRRGFGRLGYEEAPPPPIDDWTPIYESAKVTEGGYSNITGKGQWTPDAGTIAHAAGNPEYARRLLDAGAKLPPAVAATAKKGTGAGGVVLAVGVVLAIMAFLSGRKAR